MIKSKVSRIQEWIFHQVAFGGKKLKSKAKRWGRTPTLAVGPRNESKRDETSHQLKRD